MDTVDGSDFEECEQTKDEKRGNRRPWHVPTCTIIDIRRTLGISGSNIDGISGNRNS